MKTFSVLIFLLPHLLPFLLVKLSTYSFLLYTLSSQIKVLHVVDNQKIFTWTLSISLTMPSFSLKTIEQQRKKQIFINKAGNRSYLTLYGKVNIYLIILMIKYTDCLFLKIFWNVIYNTYNIILAPDLQQSHSVFLYITKWSH